MRSIPRPLALLLLILILWSAPCAPLSAQASDSIGDEVEATQPDPAPADGSGTPLSRQALRFLGRLHPMVVHFPVGLLIAAGLFELMSRRNERLRAAAQACLFLGAASAIVAAWFGWLNAGLEPHGRSVARAIDVHRWTGVATTIAAITAAALAAAAARRPSPVLQAGHRYALFSAVLLVAFAGHVGGRLVYGEDYALRAFDAARRHDGGAPGNPPIEAPSVPPATDAGFPPTSTGSEPIDFATQIRPILEQHCYECHGPDEQEGELALHERAGVFKGDPSTWVIVPGSAENSLLIELITLPPDDPDFMPHEGAPLAADQIALLRQWIDQGANWPADPPDPQGSK